jgi:hydroxymethylbilane synthase
MTKADAVARVHDMPAPLRIGTRGSKLALAQSEIVRSAILELRPEADVRLQTITTKGDVVQDQPLSRIGGNGVFVRQIEQALLDRQVDLAVHSAKDLPSALAPGLSIAAYLPRADARDVLVSREGRALADLPEGARVGTSSPRRACLLHAIRPDLELLDIRGNVDTRLRKLHEGQYDAIVLAAAGLERLGLLAEVTEWLDPQVMLPAVAQGALGVQARESDHVLLEFVARLDDPNTRLAVTAERAFLAAVGGSCSLPVGAYATVAGETVTLAGMIGSVDGQVIKGELRVPSSRAEQAGVELAGDLLARGGRALVEAASEQEYVSDPH